MDRKMMNGKRYGKSMISCADRSLGSVKYEAASGTFRSKAVGNFLVRGPTRLLNII